MNAADYYRELGIVVKHATNTLDAAPILDALIGNAGSIAALATLTSGADPEDTIEILRHMLDIEFTHFLKVYRDAHRTSA